MILTFNVEKQLIKRTDCEMPVANSENYLYAQFSFSNEWLGAKTAIFNNGTPYSVILDENNECLVPWEVITTQGFSVSVFCGQRITANTSFVKVLPSGYIEGQTPQPPSPTVYDQLQDDIDELKTSKQDKLVAGENITIDDNVISSTGSGVKNYKDLLGLPRTLYTPNGDSVEIANIPSGIYDAGKEFAITSNNESISLDKGSIFAVNHNNNEHTAIIFNGNVAESEIIKADSSGNSSFALIDLLNYDFSDFATSSELTDEETARQNADNDLQEQIDAITVSSDVIDVVGTYADLQNYDTQHVKANDIIKVMQDSTHGEATSYYRWVITEGIGAWVYVGSEGPFYTKGETNTLLQGKLDIAQGSGNEGKIPIVNSQGNLELGDQNYNNATNQPQINGNTLVGNKTSSQLGLMAENLYFTNISVSSNDWVDNTTNPETYFEDYDYKAVIACQGVTADMGGQVIFADEQAKSGDYAFTAKTGNGTVTIFSNDNSAITIPTIIAGSTVNVEQGGAGHNYSTTEQIVGTWIDGKPLYEKTYVISDVPRNSWTRFIPLDSTFSVLGYTSRLYGTSEGYNYVVSGASAAGIDVCPFAINNELGCYHKLDNGATWICTVQYTKTTDTAEVVE